MRLTEAQRDFLERVRDGQQLRLADRAEDRVRQSMRQAGFVVCLRNPRRWAITDSGRAALQGSGQEGER